MTDWRPVRQLIRRQRGAAIKNTAGGHVGVEIFSLPYILVETLILLTRSSPVAGYSAGGTAP